MSNVYRVKVVNRKIVKRGYLCPICGEYKRTKTCDCAEAVEPVKAKSKKAKKVIKDKGQDNGITR